MALPSVHRLKHRQAFADVYRDGLRRSTRDMTLRALRSRGVAPVRVGVVVSSKVSKRAVVRNRIRRRIHAAIYSLMPQLESGWILVVVVHPPATECNYVEILQQLEKLLIEVKVLHGHS